MGQITIEGQRVTIDDGFFSLSPEEQDATVDEIARDPEFVARKNQAPEATPDMPVGMQARPGPGVGPEQFQSYLDELSQNTSNFAAAPDPARNTDPEGYDRKMRAQLEARKVGEMMGDRPQMDPLAGFTDELWSSTVGAGTRMIRDGVGYGEARKREQMLQEELQARARKASPIMSTVNDIAGGVMLGGTLAKGGLTLAGKSLPIIGRTGAAALEGAGYGGLTGAGYAKQGEKAKGAMTGAVIGGVTGGMLSKAGDMIGKSAAKRAAGPAPTTSENFERGSQLYKAAKDAGVGVKQSTMQKVSGNIRFAMDDFDLDPVLQPKTSHLVSRIETAAKSKNPMSLMQMENLRKQAVRITRDATEESEKSAAGKIIETLDDVMDDARNFSVNSNDGLKALSSARNAWKTARKSEILDEIATKAQNQASGYENGLVIQMRALANNKKKMKSFSPEEQKAILSVVRRGSVRGVLAMFGRLSPTSTFGGITTGGTLAGSGILPGLALGGAGYLSKKAAESLTRSQFNAAKDLIARGGQAMPQAVNRLERYVAPTALAATGLLAPYALPTRQTSR